ncbi:MAG TPA: pirin family protein [Casimicrobiaceae bacterium]|nr:pirin family protein [Casimicrobiaceae bacterium]
MGAGDGVEAVVVPRTSDLGDGFVVRRALPSQSRRMVGPFVFLDAMGPVAFDAGRGLDVRPHPHIGLATVTYLFSGEILHRDSLGSTQPIRPGELNWMTAGHGIVHSERTPADVRQRGSTLAGLQAWVALPQALAETSPAFAHHDAAELPLIDGDGARARVIAGAFAGALSPAATLSPLFYVDVTLDAGARIEMPREHDERAAFVVDGAIEVAGESGVYDAGQLVVMKPGAAITLRARTAAKLMLLGGAPLDGPRIVWWNFVASSRERIEAAKDDWQARRFARVPGDDVEFIPLPQDRPVPDVTYP